MSFWKKSRDSARFAASLTAAADTTSAAWIAARLLTRDLSRGTRVGDVVPTGFDRCVRIMHPVPTGTGTATTWAEIARATGRIPHALMQWPAITYVAGDAKPPDVVGDGPPQGFLPLPVASSLTDVLSLHTDAADQCWYAFASEAAGLPSSRGVQFEHGRRPHVLFHAPLSAAARPLVVTADGEAAQPPVSAHLWWPDDRGWVVATDLDLRSTLVACSAMCADQLVRDATLETYEVGVEDRIDIGGDAHNPLPPRLAHLFS